MRYSPSHLGEAGDECPESLPGFLPYGMEMCLHAMLLISTGKVHCEPCIELFLGVDRPQGEIHEPGLGRTGQGYMEVTRHYDSVSTGCRNSGDVNLQKFRRVGRTVVLLRQVRPELGQTSRRAEVIR
jgi:hypothetical protein